MKIIKNILIDKTAMSSSLALRDFIVTGDAGAVFSMTIVNEDGNFYNFSENLDKNGDLETAIAFSSTPARLNPKTIGESGVYNGLIEFPAITEDDVYSIVLYAETTQDTMLSPALSSNSIYILPKIYKYHDTTVTFSLSGSSDSYNTFPSNVALTGVSSSSFISKNPKSTSISWNSTLSAGNLVIARQPLPTDFQFTTTSTSTAAGSNVKFIEVKSTTGLSVGMAVSGVGIASGSIITGIKQGYLNANKSSNFEDVYVKPKTIITNENGEQTIGDSTGGTIFIDKFSSFSTGVTITFTGKGSDASEAFNNTVFEISNLLLEIDPVVTTTDAVVSNSKTIPIASTNGIKAADTILMTGIGVTAASPHVDTVNDNVSVVVSTNQTIENGQTMTFTGSSRSATVTLDVKVLQFGVDNITLTLALDNILTVA